ncbi:hypothetical protein FO519_001790 [Halicephalobus sp. NKZ332]|nr:hypothetical protein FO519_001790 [Halicephalobus sp. NKZ332]
MFDVISISILLNFLFFTRTTSNIVHPEILEYNTKVYAEFFGEDAELDYLTDDDIRKIEYSNGFEFEKPDKSVQWSGGVVPYYLDPAKFDNRFLTEFYGALDEFHSKTCVRFRPKTKKDKSFVKIIRGDGCWSYVGMQPELANLGQELSLGDECWRKGIIVHELTHALGFFHEHSRFDRDAYIFLNASNIQKHRIRQFDKRAKELVDEIGPYDLYSIMHYEQNAFAVDKRSSTIIPKIKGARVSEMGQRIALSPVDVSKIRVLYNCSGSDFKKPDIGPLKSFKTKELNYQSEFMNDGRYNGNTVGNHPLPLVSRIRYLATPFKNFEDFTTRTGMKKIPAGFHFEFQNQLGGNDINDVNERSSFKMYPNTVESGQKSGSRCSHFSAENCLDELNECPKMASEGLCEKKPGMMLMRCKRSCCNCDSSKCFDTTDKQKFNTLCAARNSGTSPCLNLATRQNANDFCPLTCQLCVPNVKT